MIVVKAVFLFIFLYFVSFFGILKTDFNNPALAFFIPSIFSMMLLARKLLNHRAAQTFRLSVICSLIYPSLVVLVSWGLQQKYNWIQNESLMYFMAFIGNFLFPYMIFPRIKHAQNTELN
ncbi:MAG: hypothetical protein NE334_00990 [Lentisphaeraceae bacterium]|nr:hypothetical protein [Lentisphaeraceae bacterium]